MPSTISSSSIPFSSCLQSFPASGWVNFLQQVAKVLEFQLQHQSFLMNEYSGLISLGLTGLISCCPRDLTRVFSNIKVQKHQSLGAQLSLESNSHIHTWLLEKPNAYNSFGKESACNAGGTSSIPGLGRSDGKGIGNPLQYSWASLVAQLVKKPPAMWRT